MPKKDEIAWWARFFGSRISRLSLEEVGDLEEYLEVVRQARVEEDVEAIEGLPDAIAELLAPESAGDVKEGPLDAEDGGA